MGFWAGDPFEILNRVAEEIEYFESYWRGLPDNRGTNNLAWALKTPGRFFSLAHELATAFFLGARPGVKVEPYFLDPKASKGKPDILVHTPDRSFAVQCKSHDPTSARQLPFDLWQYFAGVFQRLVEDSGRNLHFTMNLQQRLAEKQIKQISRQIARLIRSGLTIPHPWQAKHGEYQLVDLGETPTTRELLGVRRSIFLSNDPLYDELIPVPSWMPGKYRFASLSVGGRRGADVTKVISKTVTAATRSAKASQPLVISVHLYQDIDFMEFPNRPMVKEHLLPWSEQFFQDHPEVAMIHLSSNHEVYNFRDAGGFIGMKHARQSWVMESPVWAHSDLESLGI